MHAGDERAATATAWLLAAAVATMLGMLVLTMTSLQDLRTAVCSPASTRYTGVLIMSPPSGFTDKVQTNTFPCFYDSGIWTPSLTLPTGC